MIDLVESPNATMLSSSTSLLSIANIKATFAAAIFPCMLLNASYYHST